MENNKTNPKEKSEKPSKRTFTISGVKFEIEDRYEFIKQIGIGSYSIVCSCFDKKESRNVAIKKVTNAFDDKNDARRILREIKLLRFFDHENLITLLDVPKQENHFASCCPISNSM